MPGNPITGIGGDVSLGSEVAHVRNWKVTREANNKTYASSDTEGWEETAEGIKKWSGSMEVFAPDGNMSISTWDEGDLLNAVLTVDANSTLSGSVRIDSIEVEVEIEGSELVGMVVNFTGHGSYTLAPEAS